MYGIGKGRSYSVPLRPHCVLWIAHVHQVAFLNILTDLNSHFPQDLSPGPKAMCMRLLLSKPYPLYPKLVTETLFQHEWISQ